jgi:hypothetical protein
VTADQTGTRDNLSPNPEDGHELIRKPSKQQKMLKGE